MELALDITPLHHRQFPFPLLLPRLAATPTHPHYRMEQIISETCATVSGVPVASIASRVALVSLEVLITEDCPVPTTIVPYRRYVRHTPEMYFSSGFNWLFALEIIGIVIGLLACLIVTCHGFSKIGKKKIEVREVPEGWKNL